ncbi:Zinc knuckle CX2CX4HX4C [Sesbania bispinosa]|nr:Zinc knuckle CX2CX4HX4C [Sesbania bispinosa]
MSHNHQSPLVIFTEEDVSDGFSHCARSLIGRIITEKPVHVISLQNALSDIWCNPKGFKVEEVESKTFQFFFEEESDMERILRGIQIWGLPSYFRTAKMGYRIGPCLGEVKDSGVFEVRDRRSFIKILVDHDSTKPLLPGINIGSHADGVMWVDFQYERLPQFCYSCGLVGHEEDTCGTCSSQTEQEESGEGNLGPWLRASQVGRRITDIKKGNTSSSENSKNKKKTPLPQEFLEKLSSL